MLVARGLVESRARAQALIMAGKVFSGDRVVAKAGDLLADDVALSVRGQDHPWVSRGGLKLDHALRHFGLSPSGRVCLDVGASTGGFSDVLLAHGAAKIHAVDVGHGQLAWKLRNDPRVVVHEKTNARYLTGGGGSRPDRGAGVRCEFHRAPDCPSRLPRPLRPGRLGRRSDQTAVRGWPWRGGRQGRGARSGRPPRGLCTSRDMVA